jgi:hypothetical protein
LDGSNGRGAESLHENVGGLLFERFIEGPGQSQTTLMPESINDHVDEDNPVRTIDAFDDMLDLAELGFDVDLRTMGCPIQWFQEFCSLARIMDRQSNSRKAVQTGRNRMAEETGNTNGPALNGIGGPLKLPA